jgi:antitoxin StbD
MEAIFANVTVSMSEFKKNPASVLRQAAGRPVAILSHNKAVFYLVEPKLFKAMVDDRANPRLQQTSLSVGDATEPSM